MRADELLVETIDGLLADHCTPERIGAAEGSLDTALWNLLTESGLTLVGIPEERGGSGGTAHDRAAIVKAVGSHAAPVPLADTLLAASVAATAGLDVPGGALALAVVRPGTTTVRVPWGGAADHLVVVAPSGVGIAAASSLDAAAKGVNYPGEPWIDVASSALAAAATTPSAVTPAIAAAAGALDRAIALAGALDRAVELSVQYANEREQFGKPIGKFQILQHYLSEMAGESAAAGAAADNAVDVIASGAPAEECIVVSGAAKAYAGRAVTTVTRLAHQLHGAIGYTDEHRLQYTTRRLWAWRDEFGSESEWAAIIGRSVCAAGGTALWPTITRWPRAGA